MRQETYVQKCPLCQLPTDSPHENPSVCLTKMTAEKDRLLTRSVFLEDKLKATERNSLVLTESLTRTITVRDQFAMAALAGVVRNIAVASANPRFDGSARLAYQLADAMIAEREKGGLVHERPRAATPVAESEDPQKPDPKSLRRREPHRDW